MRWLILSTEAVPEIRLSQRSICGQRVRILNRLQQVSLPDLLTEGGILFERHGGGARHVGGAGHFDFQGDLVD